jgi:hypothetical protein
MQSGTAAGQYMSVYVTGRTSADAAGTMETPVLVQAGAGNYHDFTGSGRAGDLSGISVDPLTGTSFWAANEYATGAPTNNWGTMISQFSLPSNLVEFYKAPSAPWGGFDLSAQAGAQVAGNPAVIQYGTSVQVYARGTSSDLLSFVKTPTGPAQAYDLSAQAGVQITDDPAVLVYGSDVHVYARRLSSSGTSGPGASPGAGARPDSQLSYPILPRSVQPPTARHLPSAGAAEGGSVALPVFQGGHTDSGSSPGPVLVRDPFFASSSSPITPDTGTIGQGRGTPGFSLGATVTSPDVRPEETGRGEQPRPQDLPALGAADALFANLARERWASESSEWLGDAGVELLAGTPMAAF